MKNKIIIACFLSAFFFLTACDGGGGDTIKKVKPKNIAPIFISTAPDIAQINVAYTYNFNIIDVDDKPDPMVVSANANDTCGGVVTDDGDGTGSYVFTPGDADVNTQCVVGLTASDGKDETEQNTTVDVGDENAAPYFTSMAPATATEDALYTYNITVADDNLPAQSLTITEGAINTCGGAIVDNRDGTGGYSFTPNENDGGYNCLLSLTVTDSMGTSAEQNTVIAINEDNKAPSFTSSAPTTATESALYTYTATVTDPDTPAQTLTCSINASDTCGGTLAGCVYSFTPTESQGGTTCTVGLNVSDGVLSADQNSTITIVEDNKAPSFTSTAPTTATESVLYTYTATVTDPDTPAQALICSTNAFNTCGGTVAGCVYTFTPTELQGGANCIVGITVTDSLGASADQNTAISVAEDNKAPSFTSTAPATATEGVLYTYVATATDPDLPAQTLTCSKNGDTCGGTLTGCAYTFTPSESQGGANCVVGLRVSDGALTADQNTTVAVAEVNTTPVWSSAPANLSVATGHTYNSTNGTATDSDLPSQMLTCSRSSSTCSFTVTVSGSGTSPRNCSMSFTAGTTPETCGVGVQVSDGAGGTITQNIMISVQQCRKYVDNDATGTNDGLSWTNAYTVIQDAVDASWYGCEIWVAEGDYYKKTAGTGSVLTMKNGVDIYGGFVGFEGGIAERLDPEFYPTYLDGENTSYHVVVGASNARLDGFYITGGNAVGGGTNNYSGGMYNNGVSNLIVANNNFIGNSASYGGGMYNDSSSPTIADCSFSANSVSNHGGGMYNSSSSPTITNCEFLGNSAGDDGGGMYNTASSSPVITGCVFSLNSAVQDAGGVFNNSSSPTITNCEFLGNSATSWGGGMYNYSSSPTITDCVFSENSAHTGAGIANIYSSPLIAKCVFSGNTGSSSTDAYGGAIYNRFGSSSPTITDCVFTANYCFIGGGISNLGSSSTITNCVFFGNSAYYGGGIDNDSSSDTITNCTFSGNSAILGGGIENYQNTSPTIINCVMWGNTASSSGPSIYNYNATTATPTVSYSDAQACGGSGAWAASCGIDGGGNIDSDPLFAIGIFGSYYLTQATSPCVNTGSATAASLGLDAYTTDPTNAADSGTVDMGYHYQIP